MVESEGGGAIIISLVMRVRMSVGARGLDEGEGGAFLQRAMMTWSRILGQFVQKTLLTSNH